MVHEVEVLAHSCGVAEPRQLRRYHVRIVQADGSSVPLDVLHPWPDSPDNLELVDRHPGSTQSATQGRMPDKEQPVAVPGQV